MADFGVSAKMEAKDDDDAEGVSGIAGTMMWMAPEVYRSKTANYDWKCDVSAVESFCNYYPDTSIDMVVGDYVH